MTFRHWTSRLLVLVTAFSSSCLTPTQATFSERLFPQTSTQATTEFSYEISPAVGSGRSGTSGVEYVDANGVLVGFFENTLVVELKPAASIEGILKKYNAKLNYQMKIPSPGNVNTGSGQIIKEIPIFVIDVSDSPKDISDFRSLAKEFGIKGRHVFQSEAGAALFRLGLRMKADKNPDLVAVSVDHKLDYATYSTEGNGAPSPGRDFWWTASSPGSNLQQANTDAWLFGDGYGTKVAVIDGGFTDKWPVDSDVVQLSSTAWSINAFNPKVVNYDIRGPSPDPSNPWHARQVSSLIFAPSNDYSSTLGVSPGAHPILVQCPVRETNVAYGIAVATSWGADIINMSMGWPAYTWPWDDPTYHVMKDAYNKGIVMVAAAGNFGDQDRNPAAFWEVIGVGAHDNLGYKARFPNGFYSNSKNVDIWAPGDLIPVATAPKPPSSWFNISGGTSLSAPIVSGTLAICKQRKLIRNMNDAVNLLRSRGNDLRCGKSLDVIRTVSAS